MRVIQCELELPSNRRTRFFNVTNFITRGLSGGKTSKADNLLMWNQMHPLTAVGGLGVKIRSGSVCRQTKIKTVHKNL